MAQLSVEVVSAEQVLWRGDAKSISAPAVEGSLGILPGHQPILAVLLEGKVRVLPVSAADTIELAITGGFLSVDENKVTIVVDPSTSEFDILQ